MNLLRCGLFSLAEVRARRASLEATAGRRKKTDVSGHCDDLCMAWTYILKCRGGSFYVGSTNDLDARFAQHSAGLGGRFTAQRLPVELLWAMEFDRIDEAWEMERKLHGWSRAKKQALINGDLEMLPKLASRAGRKAG